jgi:hypothetical protein
MKWVPKAKRPERDFDHSSPPNIEFKSGWSYSSCYPYVSVAWCLVKHRKHLLSTVEQKKKVGDKKGEEE